MRTSPSGGRLLPFIGHLFVCPSGCWLPAPRSSLSCTNGIFRLPDATYPLPEHKNADFVLEKPENGGSEGKKRTKTSILCSGSPKIVSVSAITYRR